MIYPPPNKVMKTDWFKTLRKSEFISSLIFLGIENPTNPCRFLSFDCEYHPAPFTQARQMFWENGSRHLDLNRGIFLNDSNGPTQHMSSKCWSPTETSERRFENHYPQKKWLKRHYQKKKKRKRHYQIHSQKSAVLGRLQSLWFLWFRSYFFGSYFLTDRTTVGTTGRLSSVGWGALLYRLQYFVPSFF